MKEIMLVFALLTLVHLVSSLTVHTTTHIMNERIAKQRDKTVTLTGQHLFREQEQPRRMSSSSCEDQLFVAWTATVGTKPNPDPEPASKLEDITRGRISRFLVTNTGTKHAKTLDLDWCNEMGGITTTPDCSMVTVLCRSSKPSSQVPGSIDLTKGRKMVGWVSTSQPNVNQKHYRLIDYMYLLEFDGGLSQSPKIVLVNAAIGGWNYGHWDLRINADESLYLVTLKVTTFSQKWHEGAITIMIERKNWFVPVASQGWACGPGHVMSNRVTYNRVEDTFAMYCWTDLSRVLTKGNAINYWTSKSSTFLKPTEVSELLSTPDTGRAGPWGPQNMISLGSDGFLAIAVGPPSKSQMDKSAIGLIKLPLNSDKFSPSTHHWKWLKKTVTVVNKDKDMLAFPNLQVMGVKRERFLVGWTVASAFLGVPQETFKIVEVDLNGCLRGPIRTLEKTGWGADNLWAYNPKTGCVVMTYAFETSPRIPFGSCKEGCENSKKLQLTTVCPSDTIAPPSDCSSSAIEDEAVGDASTSNLSTQSTVMWVPVAVAVVSVIVVIVVVIAVLTARNSFVKEERA